jgi:hypothetical protein
MDSHFHKNDRESNEIATLSSSSKAMTEVGAGMTNVGRIAIRSLPTMFTYK